MRNKGGDQLGWMLQIRVHDDDGIALGVAQPAAMAFSLPKLRLSTRPLMRRSPAFSAFSLSRVYRSSRHRRR
jgi:hypothetical protein